MVKERNQDKPDFQDGKEHHMKYNLSGNAEPKLVESAEKDQLDKEELFSFFCLAPQQKAVLSVLVKTHPRFDVLL